jgi:hypothetical protein
MLSRVSLRFHELLRPIGSAVLDSAGRQALPTSIKGSEALRQELSMNSLPTIPLFPAGQIVATPGALALLEQANKTALEFVSRHLRGDWGDDLCQDDKTENELSLKQGFRLLSSYKVTETEKLWIIIEADRSVTTVLLPSEY